jgi:hypothetical protein
MNKRDDGAKCQPAWRRCLLASTLLSAVWVAQADGASAADILPGRVPVQVGADSSVLCTFWTGLGAEEYFFLADPDGDPMPVSAWLRWGDPKELVDLFETLYGFAWMTSKQGLDWLRSPAGVAWLESDPGKAWKGAMARTYSTSTTDAPSSVEYVKICSTYGAGFFYIPGTDICLKVGDYIRSPIAANGEPKDYGELRTYVNNQFTRLAGFTFGKPTTDVEWSPTFRLQRSFGDGPSSTESRRSVGESPTEGRVRISRSFGDGPSSPLSGDDPLKTFAEIISGKGVSGVPQAAQSSAPSPTTQTKGPEKGAAKAPAQTTGQQKGPAAKGGKAQEAKSAEEGVKIHFKVNQAMLEKSEVGPPLAGQHVQIYPAGDEPELPSDATRSAALENAAHNQDAARCVTNASGTCTTSLQLGAEVDYGFPKKQAGLRLNLDYKTDQLTQVDYKLQSDWQIGGNYTARLQLRNYDSWVGETNPQQPKHDFSQLNSDGLNFRSNYFRVGGMEYVQLDSISLGNNGKTREQIDEIVRTYLDKFPQLGVKITFEGNICRLELPGPWIDDIKSATRPGGGIPTAAISLRMNQPRGASR